MRDARTGNPMTINEYQKLAMTTLNPALDRRDVLINGVMGLCGESGEAIDIVKKWLAQGHELDKEKLAVQLLALGLVHVLMQEQNLSIDKVCTQHISYQNNQENYIFVAMAIIMTRMDLLMMQMVKT